MSDSETDSAGVSGAADSPGMNVELVAVADVEPYENNPVDHPDKQIDALKESIKTFGFKTPIVITGDYEIVAGHARVEAVTDLVGELEATIDEHLENGNDELARNLTAINNGQVHALIQDDLTDEEIGEFRIADNKVFEHSSWDRDSLKFELRELESAIGFEDEEVEEMLSFESSGGIDYEPGEVQEEKERLEAHYKDLADAKQDRKGSIPCPHCDHLLHLDKGEMKRALKSAQKDAHDEETGNNEFSVE